MFAPSLFVSLSSSAVHQLRHGKDSYFFVVFLGNVKKSFIFVVFYQTNSVLNSCVRLAVASLFFVPLCCVKCVLNQCFSGGFGVARLICEVSKKSGAQSLRTA